MTLILTALTLLAAPQIWDGGRIAIDMRAAPTVRAPADGTRDIFDSIRDGRRSGQLDRNEARALRREARVIGALTDRYAAGGLSESEAAELAVRTEALRGSVTARRTDKD